MWPFKQDKTVDSRRVNERLHVLEEAIRRLLARKQKLCREFEVLKTTNSKLENDYKDLLIKVSRLEGALGWGSTTNDQPQDENQTAQPDKPLPLELQARLEIEEAERLALEQLGTGGSFVVETAAEK